MLSMGLATTLHNSPLTVTSTHTNGWVHFVCYGSIKTVGVSKLKKVLAWIGFLDAGVRKVLDAQRDLILARRAER